MYVKIFAEKGEKSAKTTSAVIFEDLSLLRYNISPYQPFPKQQILSPNKLKGFADDNFEFNEDGKKFSKKGKKKTLWEKEKLLVTSNFSFSHSVFERLVLQTRKNQGLFWKGLTTN